MINILLFFYSSTASLYDCEKLRSDIMEFEEIKVEEVEYKESEVVKFEEAGQEFIGRYLGFVSSSSSSSVSSASIPPKNRASMAL